MTQPRDPKDPLDVPPRINIAEGKGLGVIIAVVLFLVVLVVWGYMSSGDNEPSKAPSFAQPSPAMPREAPAPTAAS